MTEKQYDPGMKKEVGHKDWYFKDFQDTAEKWEVKASPHIEHSFSNKSSILSSARRKAEKRALLKQAVPLEKEQRFQETDIAPTTAKIQAPRKKWTKETLL